MDLGLIGSVHGILFVGASVGSLRIAYMLIGNPNGQHATLQLNSHTRTRGCLLHVFLLGHGRGGIIATSSSQIFQLA